MSGSRRIPTKLAAFLNSCEMKMSEPWFVSFNYSSVACRCGAVSLQEVSRVTFEISALQRYLLSAGRQPIRRARSSGVELSAIAAYTPRSSAPPPRPQPPGGILSPLAFGRVKMTACPGERASTCTPHALPLGEHVPVTTKSQNHLSGRRVFRSIS